MLKVQKTVDMAAPKGNKFSKGLKNAAKLKTPELKKEAYDQYCAHMADGKSKKSWYFEHPSLRLTWESMEKYILDNPSLLDPIHKEIAWCKGYQKWEKIVEDSATGANTNANTASLQMVMRNKFGWDKDHSTYKETSEPLLQKMAKRWRKSV